ncbi:hypothetical protein C7S16_1512 [Burkholderia thailandensis]|uniref:Uncharacterized protein n=1 Tax=Burkholderia thailandensis TaxID=57975 RepID=A0AAW9D3B0_BURTH|nr:hypothetical protein [Burkholderia thailandensis]
MRALTEPASFFTLNPDAASARISFSMTVRAIVSRAFAPM